MGYILWLMTYIVRYGRLYGLCHNIVRYGIAYPFDFN